MVRSAPAEAEADRSHGGQHRTASYNNTYGQRDEEGTSP